MIRTQFLLGGALQFLALLLVQQASAKTHQELNPLYRDLLEKGVPLSARVVQPLPAPTMPDDADAATQQKVLTKLAGDDYPLEELTRASVVAPHIFKFREIATQDPDVLGRAT